MYECIRCHQVKPAEDFYRTKNLTYHDGHFSYCKPCAREKARHDYHVDAAKGVASTRRWRKKNPTQHVAQTARWRERYPDKYRIQNVNRDAHHRGATGRITVDDWYALLERYQHACARCGTRDDLTIDHIVRLHDGGAHHPDNLQILCLSCNVRKDNEDHPRPGPASPLRDTYWPDVQRLYAAGVSRAEIARRLGLKRPTVYSWCYRLKSPT